MGNSLFGSLMVNLKISGMVELFQVSNIYIGHAILRFSRNMCYNDPLMVFVMMPW